LLDTHSKTRRFGSPFWKFICSFYLIVDVENVRYKELKIVSFLVHFDNLWRFYLHTSELFTYFLFTAIVPFVLAVDVRDC